MGRKHSYVCNKDSPNLIVNYLFTTLGSHIGGYEGFYLAGYNAV
jgi:hypothetical protein